MHILSCRVLELVPDRCSLREKRKNREKSLGFSVSHCWLDVPQTRRSTKNLNVSSNKTILNMFPKIFKGTA